MNTIFVLFSYYFCESLIFANISSTEPQFYRLEGVWLTESGMSLLRSISMSPLHKRRQRRSRLGTLCCEGGADGMDLREVEGDGEEGKGKELLSRHYTNFFLKAFSHTLFLWYMHNCYIGEPMECEMKMENLGSPEREAGGEKDACADGADGMADCDVLKGGDDTEDSKKRKRKPYRPGWLLLVSKKNLICIDAKYPQNIYRYFTPKWC